MAESTLATLTQSAITEVAQLRELLAAYTGLEKLLDPQRTAEPDRQELSTLLRLMNGGLHRQIELTESSLMSMQSALPIQAAGEKTRP
ncbi:hypothetical protein GT347_15885 [Xylophilus rhododendri]|uniref:Uncharacterized protein n=1 Tax=Xylophilus rhododendri TaxID=2697032 RepID=A0A857J676_9BURK|nr:hypothetical protein [Xylophilus rhododendri]QHI99326.1 hypothetical protein GT347_15885 [Xylophilus rhododendri]